MADLRLTIKNADVIERAFKQAPAIARQEIGKVVSKSLDDIHSDALKNAPVNKQSGGGNLRQSIKKRMTSQLSGIIEVLANYAVYVHEGTSPHIIRTRSAKVLASKKTNQVFGKVVHHPGTKARPFLQDAIDKNEGQINRNLLSAAKDIINKIFR